MVRMTVTSVVMVIRTMSIQGGRCLGTLGMGMGFRVLGDGLGMGPGLGLGTGLGTGPGTGPGMSMFDGGPVTGPGYSVDDDDDDDDDDEDPAGARGANADGGGSVCAWGTMGVLEVFVMSGTYGM
jgi:hypothetical protein